MGRKSIADEPTVQAATRLTPDQLKFMRKNFRNVSEGLRTLVWVAMKDSEDES